MDRFEKFVQKVGTATVTPDDLSWIVAYCGQLRSKYQDCMQVHLDSARAEQERRDSPDPDSGDAR